MNKKPPDLPNIEDATLRACLAPLMEAMHGGGDVASQPPAPAPARPPTPPAGLPAGSNDNPSPAAHRTGPAEHDQAGIPRTRAEWRSAADDEVGAFRMIEHFLAMSEAELLAAATDFPKQIGGTLARIARIKRRLSTQYDMVTTAMALLERAMARAAADDRGD